MSSSCCADVAPIAPRLTLDLFIPGCPPHPFTILDGLLRLLGRLDRQADENDGTFASAAARYRDEIQTEMLEGETRRAEREVKGLGAGVTDPGPGG